MGAGCRSPPLCALAGGLLSDLGRLADETGLPGSAHPQVCPPPIQPSACPSSGSESCSPRTALSEPRCALMEALRELLWCFAGCSAASAALSENTEELRRIEELSIAALDDLSGGPDDAPLLMAMRDRFLGAPFCLLLSAGHIRLSVIELPPAIDPLQRVLPPMADSASMTERDAVATLPSAEPAVSCII
jgi:hypothetical protein